MAVSGKINSWEEVFQKHKEKQLINPFSQWEGASHREALDKADKEYGRPVKGTETEIRGRAAHCLMNHEMITLVHTIKENGKKVNNEKVVISFGELFQIYLQISNKLVGVLLRARKHGYVDFEGEMLFQRRDEKTLIALNLQNVEEQKELSARPERYVTYDTLLFNLQQQKKKEDRRAHKRAAQLKARGVCVEN